MIEYFQISSGNWYFLFAIAILLYFIINWIVGKFLQKNTLRKAISLVSAIFLTPAVYYVFVALFFSILFHENHPEIRFNSPEWTENKSERHHMKKDLIERLKASLLADSEWIASTRAGTVESTDI